MEQPAPGILILGVPRSGTTLLRRLLDAHPNVACPAETNLFGACARFLRSDRLAEGLDFGVLSGLGFAGFEESAVLDRLRAFAFGFLSEYAAGQGKPRWAEKSAVDAFYLPAIEQLCAGHVKFVCITRHGLDVVQSIADLCDRNGGYLSELHEYVKRHPLRTVAFAHAWVDLTRQLLDLAARRPDDCTVVRYEDLVESPEETLNGVLEFLGEPTVDGLVQQALGAAGDVGLGDWKTYEVRKVSGASIGRWKDLSPDALALLAPIVNPTLAECGHEPIEAGDPTTVEDARRRYELDLSIRAMRARDE